MSFDRIASHYRWLEAITLGRALQRARIFWLDQISPRRRALIVGEGNGRFLGELLRAQPDMEIDCLDESERMLDLARARVQLVAPASLAQVRFLQADILSWAPTRSYDLLVTHFVLDCFPRAEVNAIVEKLARAAAPEAVWLLADFTVPEKGFSRLHAQAWLKAMYLFFGLTAGIAASQLVDAAPYLEAAGFTCALRSLSRGGMLKSELWRRAEAKPIEEAVWL